MTDMQAMFPPLVHREVSGNAHIDIPLKPPLRLAVVGEAWGEEEERHSAAFVGPTGRFLRAFMRKVRLPPTACLFTNVFNMRPRPTNAIENLLGPKKGALEGRPALSPGKYARPEHARELDRLGAQLRAAQPRLVLALGATASWALLDTNGIEKHRGTPAWSERHGLLVLPTYHPSAVLRTPTHRPVFYADLLKAARISKEETYERPSRTLWLEPTLEDLQSYERRVLEASLVAADIETRGGQITCIGFAPSASEAIVIPFFSPKHPNGNYWATIEEELQAWEYVRRWCSQAKGLVFHNGYYDVQFLWRQHGIPCPAAREDSMLLHHALEPEMRKSLGFLASLYTFEPAWKHMRKEAYNRGKDK